MKKLLLTIFLLTSGSAAIAACPSVTYNCVNMTTGQVVPNSSVGPVDMYFDLGYGCVPGPNGYAKGCAFVAALCNLKYAGPCGTYEGNPQCQAAVPSDPSGAYCPGSGGTPFKAKIK